MAKLADAPDLGSGGATHGGSSPLSPMSFVTCVEIKRCRLSFFLLTNVGQLDRMKNLSLKRLCGVFLMRR